MSDQRLAEGQADGTAEGLAEYWAAVDHVDDCPDAGDVDACATCAEIVAEYGDDLRTALDESPLEIVWSVGRPFTVLLGCGGPHTEITGEAYGDAMSGYYLQDVALHTYWDGHAVRRSDAIRRTADYFLELVSAR